MTGMKSSEEAAPNRGLSGTVGKSYRNVSREAFWYSRSRELYKGVNSVLEICPPPPVQSGQPLNLLPKLIRVASTGLPLLVGCKGEQAWIAPVPVIDQQIITGGRGRRAAP